MMDYRKLVDGIPPAKYEELSEKLADCILTSKNDGKMPGQLANTILFHWQQDTLESQSGLSALLEAAILLEAEKTINAFNELQMENIAAQIKEAQGP
jgi:hypothetical protein